MFDFARAGRALVCCSGDFYISIIFREWKYRSFHLHFKINFPEPDLTYGVLCYSTQLHYNNCNRRNIELKRHSKLRKLYYRKLHQRRCSKILLHVHSFKSDFNILFLIKVMALSKTLQTYTINIAKLPTLMNFTCTKHLQNV